MGQGRTALSGTRVSGSAVPSLTESRRLRGCGQSFSSLQRHHEGIYCDALVKMIRKAFHSFIDKACCMTLVYQAGWFQRGRSEVYCSRVFAALPHSIERGVASLLLIR